MKGEYHRWNEKYLVQKITFLNLSSACLLCILHIAPFFLPSTSSTRYKLCGIRTANILFIDGMKHFKERNIFEARTECMTLCLCVLNIRLISTRRYSQALVVSRAIYSSRYIHQVSGIVHVTCVVCDDSVVSSAVYTRISHVEGSRSAQIVPQQQQ